MSQCTVIKYRHRGHWTVCKLLNQPQRPLDSLLTSKSGTEATGQFVILNLLVDLQSQLSDQVDSIYSEGYQENIVFVLILIYLYLYPLIGRWLIAAVEPCIPWSTVSCGCVTSTCQFLNYSMCYTLNILPRLFHYSSVILSACLILYSQYTEDWSVYLCGSCKEWLCKVKVISFSHK